MECKYNPAQFFFRLLKYALISILSYSTLCLFFHRNPAVIFQNSAFNGSFPLEDSLISAVILLPVAHIGKWLFMQNLLGFLFAGFVLHLPWFNNHLFISAHVSSILRKIAFVIILERGGMSIDLTILKKRRSWMSILILCVIPVGAELIALFLCTFYVGFDSLSSLSLAFILSAVSPAVVIPEMLEVDRKGYGKRTGITIICIAAATFNDVLCVTGYSITSGMTFGSDRSILSTLLHFPVEIALGWLIGILLSLVVKFSGRSEDKYSDNPDVLPSALMLVGGLSVLLWSEYLNSRVMGPVAVLVIGFYGGKFLKATKEKAYSKIKKHFDFLWYVIFMPLLFGLIGFRMDITTLLSGNSGYANIPNLGLTILIILGGWLARLCATTIALSVSRMFVLKENIFIAIAWSPKATIQAALATAYLDEATRLGLKELQPIGHSILTFCVFSILLSAPSTQALLRALTSRLLAHDGPEIATEANEAVTLMKSDQSLPPESR